MYYKRGSKFDAMTGELRSPDALFGPGIPHAANRVGNASLQAQHRRKAVRAWGLLLVLASLALEVVGCNNWIRPVSWAELGPQEDARRREQKLFQVVPKRNNMVVALSPEDIVRVMQRVGFADEQILDLGTDLHNALRLSGAAVVLYRREPLVMFVADDDYVRIRSRSGAFEYQVSKGQFVSPPARED